MSLLSTPYSLLFCLLSFVLILGSWFLVLGSLYNNPLILSSKAVRAAFAPSPIDIIICL